MKDLYEAIYIRLKTPYLGYAILAFVALNWRGFFYLILSAGEPKEKLDLFDAHTDVWSLIVFPLIIGTLIAASSAWLRFIFAVIERKPKELFENLVLEADHNKTIKHGKLEQARAALFATKEKELIDRAKRDTEVADIQDPVAKQNLIDELNSLREQREQLSKELESKNELDNSLSEPAKEILIAASKEDRGSIVKSASLSQRSIHAGTQKFGMENQKAYVKYEAALDELIMEGYVIERGHEGQVFEITNKGWLLIEEL